MNYLAGFEVILNILVPNQDYKIHDAIVVICIEFLLTCRYEIHIDNRTYVKCCTQLNGKI